MIRAGKQAVLYIIVNHTGGKQFTVFFGLKKMKLFIHIGDDPVSYTHLWNNLDKCNYLL